MYKPSSLMFGMFRYEDVTTVTGVTRKYELSRLRRSEEIRPPGLSEANGHAS